MLRAWVLIAACGIALGIGMGPPIAGAAIEVVPLSYTFDGVPDGIPDGDPPGTWDYSDWTGDQLTDGEYGTTPWHADQGDGRAYEWVGWVNTPTVSIDFDFGATTVIDSARIGSYQEYTPGLIYLPDVFLFSSSDAVAWTPLASQTDTDISGYYTFEFDSLGFDDRYLRVRLDQRPNLPDNNRWTFTDEMDFYGPHTPEPTTLLIWGILGGLVTAAAWRRRQRTD